MSAPTRPGATGLASVLFGGPELRGAACAARAPLWDDHTDGRETDRDRKTRHRTAITVCGDCPVRTACLRNRLANPRLGGGVWGGHLFPTPAPTTHGVRERHCPQCQQPFIDRTGRKYCDDNCQHDARQTGVRA